jgi:heme exporter protein C
VTSLLDRGAPGEVDAPTGTGSAATRWLGIVTLVGMVAFVVLGLWVSPEDVVQNDLVRMFYVHVPVATVSFTACFITGLGSVMFLWRKSWWWDTLAYASAELAALFTVFTLVTGSLWGRPAWGTYWEWDARLTSTALLMLLLLGYLALHKAPAPAENQAKRAAIVGLLLVPNVLIVRQSVDWWRSLHQRATINLLGNTQIAGVMLFTFFVGLIVMSCAFLWLLVHRFRVAWLEHEVDAVDLADAIVERRAEGDA